jgi:Helicase HerA, central domain
MLINSFVPGDSSVRIGSLRYTETPPPGKMLDVPVLVDPLDFIGRGSGNRTALFGKTRMGKSNAIKVIADTIFQTPANVSQLIFDPSGEYTYINSQDGTSLFALNAKKSVRYSLSPRVVPEEANLGLSLPLALKINFYDNPVVGHSLVASLFGSVFARPPNYVRDVLEWEPPEPSSIPSVQADASRFNREWRELGIWWALLDAAGYGKPPDTGPYSSVQVPFRKEVKEVLAADPNIPKSVRVDSTKSPPQIRSQQPLSALRWIYRQVANLFEATPALFPDSGNGPYFSKGAQSMLRILVGAGISGTTYFRPFARYHDLQGSDVFSDISQHLESGTSVFVDYSNAPEGVAQNLSERISQNVLIEWLNGFRRERWAITTSQCILRKRISYLDRMTKT